MSHTPLLVLWLTVEKLILFKKLSSWAILYFGLFLLSRISNNQRFKTWVSVLFFVCKIWMLHLVIPLCSHQSLVMVYFIIFITFFMSSSQWQIINLNLKYVPSAKLNQLNSVIKTNPIAASEIIHYLSSSKSLIFGISAGSTPFYCRVHSI